MSDASKPQTDGNTSLLKERAKMLLDRLVQAYPAAFLPFGERGGLRPLKLGIHKDLVPVIIEWGYDKATLKYTLGMYTRQLRYQIALLKSEHRIDLDGKPAGEISEANRQTAQDKVDQINEKRKQTQKAQRPTAKQARPARVQRSTSSKGVSEKALAALQRKFNN